MNKRRARQVAKVAGALLVQGEQIECASLATVGSVSAKRQILTTALAATLSAGMVIAVVQPRPMYCVLTNQRMLFLDVNTTTGSAGKLLMSIPLAIVTAGPLITKALGFGLRTELTVEGEEKGLQLSFPLIAKRDGRNLAGRLPVAA